MLGKGRRVDGLLGSKRGKGFGMKRDGIIRDEIRVVRGLDRIWGEINVRVMVM